MKVCVVQTEPLLNNKTKNFKNIINKLLIAHLNNSKVIVFPELSTSGYEINKNDLHNETIDQNERFINKICKESKKYKSLVVLGIPEKSNFEVYNSAIIIDNGEVLGTYRKNYLWADEMNIFKAGTIIPKFNSTKGDIAVIICYDLWKVDINSIPKRIKLLIIPTNWVTIYKEGGQNKNNPVGLNIASKFAKDLDCYVLCSNRVGKEYNNEFIGNSGIINRNGEVVSGTASTEKEDILYYDIND